VQGGFGQHLLEPVVPGVATAGRHEAREFGDLALESVAEILDECCFEVGGFARRQRAGDRERHAPQSFEMRHHAPDCPGDLRLGIGAGAARELHEQLKGAEKALGPAALESQFARDLAPALAFFRRRDGWPAQTPGRVPSR